MKRILYFLMVILPLSSFAQKKQIFQTELYGRGIYNNNNFGQIVDDKLPEGYVRFQNTITAGIGIKQHFNIYKNFRIGIYAEYYKSHFKMSIPSLFVDDDVTRIPLSFDANTGMRGFGLNINKVFTFKKFDLEIGFETLFRGIISNDTKYIEDFYTDGIETPGQYKYYYYHTQSSYPGNPFYDFEDFKSVTGLKYQTLTRLQRVNLNVISSKPIIENTKIYGLIGAEIQVSRYSMEMFKFILKEYAINQVTNEMTISEYENTVNRSPYQVALKIGLIYKW